MLQLFSTLKCKSAYNRIGPPVVISMGDSVKTATCMDPLMAMFRHSVSQVFPEYLEVITSNDYNKSFVKITKDSSQQIPTHDITCNIPKLLFWHAYRMQHQAVSSSCKNNKLKKRKREVRKRVITIVSDYGTTTTGVSARDLGMKILQAIPIELIADASLADIRLSEGNSGSIHIVTMKHFRSQGEKGFVLCPSCGKFVRGEQGLWWHQKMVHGSDHTQAKEVAAAQISSMALVPFDNVETSPEIGRGGGGSKATQPHQPPMKRQRKEEQPQPKRKTLSPGMEACKNGDFETLKKLVELEHWDAKTSVDHVHGSPALLWAAGGGHLNICQYLVNVCHADPNARQLGRRSFGGRTALHWAARCGHNDICHWLVKDLKVPIDAMTDDGTTPFCWCCWQGHKVLAMFFANNGCDPHVVNQYGCNVTMWAVQGVASLELLHMLKDLGCSFLLHNSNGHGCMHKAGQRGKMDVVEWLVKEIPEIVNIEYFNKDGEGYRPSGLAHVEGHTELAEYLKKIEASIGL